jgi:hypothetical protein
MTGGELLGLTLLSMGWLFFLGGMALNAVSARKSERGLGLLPAIVGSVTVFFSLSALARAGLRVPWPWLWILLPLAFGLVLLRARK